MGFHIFKDYMNKYVDKYDRKHDLSFVSDREVEAIQRAMSSGIKLILPQKDLGELKNEWVSYCMQPMEQRHQADKLLEGIIGIRNVDYYYMLKKKLEDEKMEDDRNPIIKYGGPNDHMYLYEATDPLYTIAKRPKCISKKDISSIKHQVSESMIIPNKFPSLLKSDFEELQEVSEAYNARDILRNGKIADIDNKQFCAVWMESIDYMTKGLYNKDIYDSIEKEREKRYSHFLEHGKEDLSFYEDNSIFLGEVPFKSYDNTMGYKRYSKVLEAYHSEIPVKMAYILEGLDHVEVPYNKILIVQPNESTVLFTDSKADRWYMIGEAASLNRFIIGADRDVPQFIGLYESNNSLEDLESEANGLYSSYKGLAHAMKINTPIHINIPMLFNACESAEFVELYKFYNNDDTMNTPVASIIENTCNTIFSQSDIQESKEDAEDLGEEELKQLFDDLSATVILEKTNVSHFKIQFDDDGNLIINKAKVKEIQFEYKESHNLLKSYKRAENYESMKPEVAKLWAMNLTLEEGIRQNKPTVEKSELIKLRGQVLHDFKYYLKYITMNEPEFNFTEYYEQSEYNKDTIKINKSTLEYTIEILKKILTGK